MNSELKLIEELMALDTGARERILAYVSSAMQAPWTVGKNGEPPPRLVPSLRRIAEEPPVELTVIQASKLTRKPVASLYRAMKQKAFPYVKVQKGKRKVALIKAKDVQAWAAEA